MPDKTTELRILITDRSRPTLDRLKRYRDEEGLPSLAEAARQILKVFLIDREIQRGK